MGMALYRDRSHAGKELARALTRYAGLPDVLVLGLPRGGVPVGYQVARALTAPLDVFVVRKLGVPAHPELAMGAVASGGVRVLNDEIIETLCIPWSEIEAVERSERRELERREHAYRGERRPEQVAGRVAILVDDGLATGSTMRAAVAGLRQCGPRSVVVGVPIAARSTCDELRCEVDDIVCAVTPEPFDAVGLWYEDFSQVSDSEVRQLLEQALQHCYEKASTQDHH